MIYFTSYVEDVISQHVLIKLINYICETENVNICFCESFPIVKNGFGDIKKEAKTHMNMAAKSFNILILTDLDRYECPNQLIKDWYHLSKKELPERLLIRIVIREIEAWVLADAVSFSKYMGIPVANFDVKIESVKDTKEFLLNIIRNKGRKKWQKEMLPLSTTATFGPNYNDAMCDFVDKYWSPQEAALRSVSLKKAIERISTFVRTHDKIL